MTLANSDPQTMLAVTDLDRAQRFYEETLGLTKVDEEGEEVVVLRSGAGKINLYKSEFAGTNKATSLTWQVSDVRELVEELKAKGVAFEHYQMEGLKQDGDVYEAEEGDMQVAWFKDPDGNILSLVSN